MPNAGVAGETQVASGPSQPPAASATGVRPPTTPEPRNAATTARITTTSMATRPPVEDSPVPELGTRAAASGPKGLRDGPRSVAVLMGAPVG